MVTVSSMSRPSAGFGRSIVSLTLKGASSVVLYVVCLVVASALSPVTQGSRQSDPQTLLALLGFATLYTVALSYPVVRSRWTGWRTVLALFVAYAGVTPVLLQIESLVFLLLLVPILPPDVPPRIVINGFISALLFSPLVVLIWRNWGKRGDGLQLDGNRGWTLTEWAWKLVLCGMIYTVIYFGFGNLVAVPLAGPAFNEYYHGLQLPAWMPLLQIARGAFWALIMVPVLRMMGGRWWEPGLAVALLSSFLTAAPLFAHNDFMPDQIRFAHFFELLSSNFVYGWVIFWLFHRHHNSPRALVTDRVAEGCTTPGHPVNYR